MAISTIGPDAISGLGYGMKNRIINGDMRIDQRNAGAAVTLNNAGTGYPVDRFFVENNSGAAVLSVQQVMDAPSGFVNSLKVTVTTADGSLGSSDRAYVNQRIEGYNTRDLNWGTASASPVTLSFWTKSSVTGIHGGVILNNVGDRTYAFTYTISSANTWEYKTITIPGATTGTWEQTNSRGIQVLWGLGVGSTFSGTPNTWLNQVYLTATGAVDLTSTLNATWQITGVQLEKGSVATSFDYRPYGTELALCQRYYIRGYQYALRQNCDNLRNTGEYVTLPVFMRANPTVTTSTLTSVNVAFFDIDSAKVFLNGFTYRWRSSSTIDFQLGFDWYATAEL